ncbi:MAG: homoserine dehydrogenase [Glaciecola sp.]|jgi:homoserine dehydrogenase
MGDQPLRIGLLGFGTVGSGVAQILSEGAANIAARVGTSLVVTRAAVTTLDRDRGPVAEGIDLSTDPMSVVEADDVDVVVEVMGGREPASALLRRALELGKPVVTANKELVAHEGPELYQLAADKGIDFMYEAAVAGAIPIIRPLKQSLAGDRVRRVVGILNGTTNYILTRMSEEGAAYADVLADAQRLGYAEADPTADVGGHDAASKAAILASLAFDTSVRSDDVHREGIESITARDIEIGSRLGYVVKLLGIASDNDGQLGVRVHPTFLPRTHALAAIRDSFNAIWVQADAAGELLFSGRGAGSLPTGSAVVGDIIDVARNLRQTARGPVETGHREIPIQPIEDLQTQYYVRLDVVDEPGVLAQVATTFGWHGVSISQVLQELRDDAPEQATKGSVVGGSAELVIVTHRAREGDLRACVEELQMADKVHEVSAVIRVESEVFA